MLFCCSGGQQLGPDWDISHSEQMPEAWLRWLPVASSSITMRLKFVVSTAVGLVTFPDNHVLKKPLSSCLSYLLFITFMPKKQPASMVAGQSSSHSWAAVITWGNSEQNIYNSPYLFSLHLVWAHYCFWQLVLKPISMTVLYLYLYWKQYKFACSPHARLGSLWVLWAVSHNPEVNRLTLLVCRCDSEHEWLFVPICQTCMA